MLQKKFLIYIFSFLGGILFHSYFLNARLSLPLLTFFLGLSFLLFFFQKTTTQIIALSIILFLLGFLRFDTALHPQQKHVLDYFAEHKIELQCDGIIKKRPVIKDGSQNIIVALRSIQFGKHKENVSTKMSLKVHDYQEYHYGQEIQFNVVPQIPKAFTTDGGRSFDYEHFLEKDGIYYVGKPTQVRVIREAHPSIFSFLYGLKDALLQKIYRYVPRPESSLLAGVLLGEKMALGDELENDFRTTGLMHIVVLSGYNVSIIITAVTLMLAFLPLYTRSIIAVTLIVAFALLVGAGPTVVRASIMALFIVLAGIVGRPYHVERVLLLAGALMVLYNPWILFYDISFQFSFLATYGLIAIMPLLEKPLRFVPAFLDLRDSAMATISAQLMVMPLILYYIGDFSMVSVLVNMLVLFMVPINMALGFIMSVVAFVSPTLAHLVAIPTTLSLKYVLVLVRFFAGIPFAKFTVQKFSFWWIVTYYIFIFWLLLKKKKKVKNNER